MEAALTRVPSLAPAHFHLGRLAAERGDPEQAVRHFQRALDLQPEATVVHLPLAAAHRALGNDDAAERHAGLRGEGSLNLEDPWLARMRGRATGASRQLDTGARAFAQGEFERAEAAFRNAVEQAPEDAVARLNLGSALARLGRVDEAREQLRRAADLDPENARVHFNLAKLEAAGGDTAAAVSGYRRALELDPSYLSARFNLANTLLRSGDFDDALDAFRQVVATDAAHGPASLGEMVCLSRLGRDAEAIARAEAARQALPESPAMAEALARLLSASPPPELRDGPRALGILSELVAKSTDLGTIEALAMAHAAAGDFPQAVSWQERALAAVRQSRRADLVAPMAANLARYRQGQVAEAPWHGAAFGAEW
ncbi:MAG: tetratricopeptide repeat protein [Acidobacteriota bacterium]